LHCDAFIIYPNFCELGIQTGECPICKNRNPCGTGVFVYCKVAIGGLIATLQNFRFIHQLGSSMQHCKKHYRNENTETLTEIKRRHV
jgi:hypothetical protein